MLKDIQNEAEQHMKKSIEIFNQELGKVRTGRAHPSLLDSVMVLYYGNATPISQVANISVSDARTLTVTPCEKSTIQAIDKAIRASDLGLNPSTSGSVLHVPLPPLTEERRKDMVKHVRSEAEKVKVIIRNIRRDSNTLIKDLFKAKQITEDEERKGQEAIQKVTDKYIIDIDKLTSAKEAELMQI
jgi:ribosome recycling factor